MTKKGLKAFGTTFGILLAPSIKELVGSQYPKFNTQEDSEKAKVPKKIH